MATVRKLIEIDAAPEAVWDAVGVFDATAHATQATRRCDSGEWDEESGRWRSLKPNNCGCLSDYGTRAGSP